MINLAERERTPGRQRYYGVMAGAMLNLALKLPRACFPTSIVKLRPRRHLPIKCTDQQPSKLHMSEVLS